ncbi:MAG: hypothetical protein ACI4SD_01815 [Suilimivivens sp.]
MRKTVKIIGVTVVLCLFVFMVSVPIVNDYTALRTAKELEKIPMPEQTELVECISRAGKLVGNGNGMQFLGCILIKSNLTLEELKAYYSAYAEKEWECVVEKQTTQELQFLDHVNILFDTEIKEDNYYIVYSWGEGMEFFSEFDIRGH